MPNLSGSGGRSSHVNYASTYWFGRMYPFLLSTPNVRKGAAILAVTYQADTGASGGSLKRAARGLNIY
jgi:hypothetical protein